MDLQDRGGGSTDPRSCISDVLLDLGTISTQFILALQDMERSTRRLRLADETTADAVERRKEIERVATEHINGIQNLCGRMSLDLKEGTVCSHGFL